MRVLIVDDDASVEAMLTVQGFQTLVAASTDQADAQERGPVLLKAFTLHPLLSAIQSVR